jgi:hypothetical protein
MQDASRGPPASRWTNKDPPAQNAVNSAGLACLVNLGQDPQLLLGREPTPLRTRRQLRVHRSRSRHRRRPPAFLSAGAGRSLAPSTLNSGGTQGYPCLTHIGTEGDPRSLRRIAGDYGVSPGMVSKIKNGRRSVNATKGKRDPRPGGSAPAGLLRRHPCISRIVWTPDDRWRVKLISGYVLIDDVLTPSGFVRQVVTEFERRSLADVAWEIRRSWVRLESIRG